MRMTREFAQHRAGIGGITRLFQHFAIQHHNRIRAQHRQILRGQFDTRLRFIIGQTADIDLRRFVRLTLLFNVSHDALECQTKLS